MVVRNYEQTWLPIEITNAFNSPQTYQAMEKYSGPSTHIYILDYDKDGFMDIILPNQMTNDLILLRNPGYLYWRRTEGIAS